MTEQLHVTCDAHPAELAPARWCRKVELAYPERTYALVYGRPPPDDEWRELMLRLQAAAACCEFTITVYDASGQATHVPAISAPH